MSVCVCVQGKTLIACNGRWTGKCHDFSPTHAQQRRRQLQASSLHYRAIPADSCVVVVINEQPLNAKNSMAQSQSRPALLFLLLLFGYGKGGVCVIWL